MQDGFDRSIKNGGHRGAENRDASQEDLYTRPKLEATLCRRSSLEESPSTPPPPPPPSSGAPVWERRPRVKTQLQFSFYIQTKLKTEKTRAHTLYSVRKHCFVPSAATNCLSFFRSWSWRSLRFPSPPRPPPSAPFSHDPVPHPFTGERIFLTCIKIYSSDISAHRQNKQLLFGTDLPAQCSIPPTLLTRVTAAGEPKAIGCQCQWT